MKRFIGIFTVVSAVLAQSGAGAQPSLGLPWRGGQVWKVSQEYHPSFGAQGRWCCALDFNRNSADDTDDVVAVASGVAYARETTNPQVYCAENPIRAGYNWSSPFRWVEIVHENGWVTKYAHLSAFGPGLAVDVGVNVAKGQVIGYLGNSGCTYQSATHLDFTLLQNDAAQSISQFEGKRLSDDSSPILESGGYNYGDQYLSYNYAPAASTWHPNGTLIRAAGDTKVYFLQGGKKRWVYDETAFEANGFSWEDVVEVSSEEISCYDEGETIYAQCLLFPSWEGYRVGTLVRQTGTTPVYVVGEDGMLHWIDTTEAEFYSFGYTASMIHDVPSVWGIGYPIAKEDFSQCNNAMGGGFEYPPDEDASLPDGYSYGSVPPNPQAAGQSLIVPAESPSTITLTGGDPNADPVTFSIVTSPSYGTLSAIAAHNRISAYVTYTPNPGFSGHDSFTFKVNDGVYDSIPAVVSLLVENTPPLADSQSVSANAGTPMEITLTGSGANAEPVTFSLAASPSHGTLGAIAAHNRYSAKVVYTPAPGYLGSDSFTFRTNDGVSSSPSATVSLTVAATVSANPPTADAQSVSVNGAPVEITLIGYGANAEPVTFSIATLPSHGTLGEVMPNNRYSAKVTYTPALNYSGSDSFTFRTSDGVSSSAPATVSVTVAAVVSANPPIADAQSVSVNGAPVIITLIGYGANWEPVTFSLASLPTHGTLGEVAANNRYSAKVTYTPAPGFTGADSFTFKVNDGVAYSAPATVSVQAQ